MTYGSVCSGIEAAHFAFEPLGYKQVWSSEISNFPSKLLSHYYPEVPNLGDMVQLPELIINREVVSPDVFCGGTPCQAFSLAGWQNGLEDERGLLTLKFIEIANSIDQIRIEDGLDRSVVLWENVEGVLNDRTNAFGNFIGGLSGHESEIAVEGKWPKSGFYEGPTRRVAWRVLDSKYFGLPHQRKRLYVVATGKNHHPDNILFELGVPEKINSLYNKNRRKKEMSLFNVVENNHDTVFEKRGVKFEFFRDYTDCLYAAYGTKWNGNAAAYNGSLYVSQDNRIRRLIPEECELLMGFPKGYTDINGAKHTSRYQGVGNSWAIPVIKWIGENISNFRTATDIEWKSSVFKNDLTTGGFYYPLGDIKQLSNSISLNTSMSPNTPKAGDLKNIACVNTLDKFYISPKACRGILRRKNERNLKMNSRLEELMTEQSKDSILV